ncbi:sugar phosphate isomerase/epimerase family protein [Paenibacillus wynnii]|uniref:sugar phosphate isomerase/epimerase family protein n=1 Tax=Paenibacillus wynnii TaxID=268407 RepID=UPI002791D050|nr:sugar phosphate isomerase/epimerase [Paenibacillus wynnii]MDQ0195328.1 sugar phosphate isomerase/epimerase [Paenibacillus wynnii]
MKPSMIGAQMYTFREYTQTAEELRTTFQKLRSIGYTAVQVSGIGPIDPLVVKQIADENGLEICATHVPWTRLVDDLDALTKEHQLWDCKYIGLGGLPDMYRTSLEGYRTFVSEISAIAKLLKENYGLQFIYHNHDFEFERLEGGRTGMDILLAETDPDYVSFELDLYWLQAAGADPVEWIHKVNGRMQVVHLKDMAIIDRKPVFAEVGEGNMNYPGIIKACRETGVEWYVVEQDVCRRDPFESVAISLDYLLHTIEGV